MTGVSKDERRARRRALKANVAVALDGELLFTCRMVDFSEAGARLEAAGQAAPDRFQLIDVEAGMVFSARVAWRRDRQIGVAFLSTRSIDEAPEWIQLLWREVRHDLSLAGRSAAA